MSRTDNFPNKQLIHRREFEHKGVTVLELLYQWGPDRKKLLWVRPPLEGMVLPDGVTPNPIVHVDATAEMCGKREGEQLDNLILKAMQRRCEEEFDRHWKL